MEQILTKVYYEPSSGAAFSGIDAVHKEAVKHMPKIKRSQVKKWLSEQYAYTMHKPARRRFPQNKVYVHGMNIQFQIDLADMMSHSANIITMDFKYLLTCIDVFSKYAWAIPDKKQNW